MAKRFYKVVSVQAEAQSFSVRLDGRELKSPGRIALPLPTKALAERLAAEWDAVEEKIDPAKMPITRMLNVVAERTPVNRDAIVAEARRYAGTDLVSYRAPDPRELREKQAAAWDEWVEWAAERGVALATTQSLIAIEQSEASLKAAEDYAAQLDDLRLTLFVHLVAVYGSTVLAMAVMDGALDGATAFDLSRLDTDYQIELWGEDEEQAEITQALREETLALVGILDTL